ncbi:LysM peptidoglycan-binding domain-containing protein [Agromyces salentinus]|uniref:LysM peptidoglycan-binding domain-containing protein n=1 Tax=Agromyces salentinus TaxID=269421 RepID=UPI001FE9BE35|nr:LysM peptidoglycan-binding domain-containing protein [Agromyces salentinus]
MITLPVAFVGALAVTLGIVQPAEAAPQTSKRQAKAKAIAPGAKAAASVAALAAPAEVTVAEGDTISGIAERYGLATAEILAANGLGWSSLIFPGQRLALPGGAPPAVDAPPPAPDLARHTVVAGDTVSGIAERYGLEVAQVLSANGLGRSSLIFPGESIVLPPSGGVASSTAQPLPVSEPVVATPVAETAPAAPAAPPKPPAPEPDRPATLTEEMRQNARVVIEVGRQTGVSDAGILAALVAAAQESGLRNVASGDRDSLGLFQQRPSQGWGTPEQVMDPVRAARAFYGGPDGPNVGVAPGLLDIDGWEAMPADAAAQAVQKSAHPAHYAKWVTAARAWLAELG